MSTTRKTDKHKLATGQKIFGLKIQNQMYTLAMC